MCNYVAYNRFFINFVFYIYYINEVDINFASVDLLHEIFHGVDKVLYVHLVFWQSLSRWFLTKQRNMKDWVEKRFSTWRGMLQEGEETAEDSGRNALERYEKTTLIQNH